MAKYANIASQSTNPMSTSGSGKVFSLEVPANYVSTKPKPKYSLEQIEDMRESGISYNLPDSTIALITQLSKLVGSPEYIRTPVFSRNRQGVGVGNNGVEEGGWQRKESARRPGRDQRRPNQGQGRGRDNGNPPPVSDSDWELLKSYKPTAKITPQEKDKLFFEMKGILNKISDKNYESQTKLILEMLARNMEKEDFERITELVFNVASSNKFYAALYANLFCVLLEEYPVFKSMLEREMTRLVEGFATMEFVDPNEDYDKFCEMNLENEGRKSLCILVAHLMKKKIVTIQQVCCLITKIEELLLMTLEKENHKDVAFEMTEAIFALNSEGSAFIKENIVNENEETKSLWENVLAFEKEMIKRKPRSMPSFDNKILFKWMDISDMS
jgi:hypothetical protein